MAPIKLEDNMKERLEERTIEPTVAAWDRISSKLDAEQGVKKSKRVLWMSIAASFVGGALIALFVFQNMGDTTKGPVLVDAENESLFIDPTETIQKEEKSESLQQIEEAVVQNITTVNEASKSEKETVQEQDVSKQSVASTVENTKVNDVAKVAQENKGLTQEAVIVSVQKEKEEKSPLIKGSDELGEIITENLGEAVAQVENEDSILDTEIDNLLKNAQREHVSQQVFNQKTNTVDANVLLLDVEAEVAPLSFRNKVFEVIAEGYEKARDAVANRNN
ncbi:hypothetical protein [uncultured Dokdonia sp.]|uniref:hypothetical protein n=1 Tax=uncultured Dokdonia sp. TaxID=575653 RepID=UPI002630AD49|nr:hypothetical protein [uncultured Dokdonia sp.]